MKRLIARALGLADYVLDETRESALRASSVSGKNPSEMLRVTDSLGNEYLCPVAKLKGASFVSETDKRECFDYSAISQHRAL